MKKITVSSVARLAGEYTINRTPACIAIPITLLEVTLFIILPAYLSPYKGDASILTVLIGIVGCVIWFAVHVTCSAPLYKFITKKSKKLQVRFLKAQIKESNNRESELEFDIAAINDVISKGGSITEMTLAVHYLERKNLDKKISKVRVQNMEKIIFLLQ